MKRIVIILILIVVAAACKKTSTSPEGPTDIRIYNTTSDKTFENVVVNTSEEEFNFGTVLPGAYSEYHRYNKAYPKSDITMTIGGVVYTAGPQDYTYAVYLGQGKFAYRVFISDNPTKKLDMTVVAEAPLD